MSYIRSDQEKNYRRELITSNKPWTKSTGPKTPEGKKIVSKNSTKHGDRSQAAINKLKEIRSYIRSSKKEIS